MPFRLKEIIMHLWTSVVPNRRKENEMRQEFKFIINMALSYGLGYLLARLSARKEIKRLHEKCEKLQEFIDKHGDDCNG